MISPSQVEFTQLSRELGSFSRRDVTQVLKLAKYKKSATSMLKKDPLCGNTLLGLVAGLEHDIEAMHAHHKKAIQVSECCFSLMYYALSLERSCLWSESARYALFALDHDPENLQLLDALINIAPLTGRFSLLKRLLAQRQQLGKENGQQPQVDHQAIGNILAKSGLLEKDLKEVVTAIGEALSETDVILSRFRYEIVTEKEDASFIHYRFVIPDQFVASYYEELIAEKLDAFPCHPRIFDVFSLSVENSTIYELYHCMEKELEASADTIRVPDPAKMKQLEELVEGVEI